MKSRYCRAVYPRFIIFRIRSDPDCPGTHIRADRVVWVESGRKNSLLFIALTLLRFGVDEVALFRAPQAIGADGHRTRMLLYANSPDNRGERLWRRRRDG